MNRKPKVNLYPNPNSEVVYITETTYDNYFREYTNRMVISYSNRKEDDISYCLQRFEGDTIANWTSQPDNYITSATLDKARKLLKSHRNKLNKQAREGKNHPAYTYMFPIFKVTMEYYKDDFLYHDCRILTAYNPDKFIWIISPSHTHFIMTNSSWNRAVIEYCTKQKDVTEQYYYWDGKRLNQIHFAHLNHYIGTLEKTD